MASPLRLSVFALAFLFVLSVGTVAAESQAADSQPGFGVLIAAAALLVAGYIARRKRRKADVEG